MQVCGGCRVNLIHCIKLFKRKNFTPAGATKGLSDHPQAQLSYCFAVARTAPFRLIHPPCPFPSPTGAGLLHLWKPSDAIHLHIYDIIRLARQPPAWQKPSLRFLKRGLFNALREGKPRRKEQSNQLAGKNEGVQSLHE